MTRPLFVAVLELRRYLSDRGELVFGIALPVALFALMYLTFGGGGSFNGTVHVVDADGGAVTADILDRLERIDGLRVERLSAGEASARLERSAILTAVVFPAGFSDRVASGEGATVLVRRRGQGGQEGQVAANIVRSVAQQVTAEHEAVAAVSTAVGGVGVSAARASETVRAMIAGSQEMPAVVVESRAVGGSDEFVDRLLPGILVMFLMFAVTLSSQAIVDDRRLGTLERLMTTRLTLWEMFGGRFLAGVLRALLQTLVLLSLGFAALQVGGGGQYLQVLVMCLLVSAAVSAIGLAIGALCTSRDQAIWASVVVTMFMTVFGGTFFPTSGGAMDTLSRTTINRYAIDAMDGIISGGETLAGQGPEAAVIAGFALVALAVARWGFRASDR